MGPSLLKGGAGTEFETANRSYSLSRPHDWDCPRSGADEPCFARGGSTSQTPSQGENLAHSRGDQTFKRAIWRHLDLVIARLAGVFEKTAIN